MDNILSLVLDVHTLFCEISLPYIKLVFGCFRKFSDALMVTAHAQQLFGSLLFTCAPVHVLPPLLHKVENAAHQLCPKVC